MSNYKPRDDIIHFEKALDMLEKWFFADDVYYVDDGEEFFFFTSFTISADVVEFCPSNALSRSRRRLSDEEYTYLKGKIRTVVKVINTRKLFRVGEFEARG